MSSLKCNKIENVAGTLGYEVANSWSHRNILINGGFDIWQRGTSNATSGFLADRWIRGGIAGFYARGYKYLDKFINKNTYRFDSIVPTTSEIGYIAQLVELKNVGINEFVEQDLTFSIDIRSASPYPVTFGAVFREGNSGVHTTIPITLVSNPLTEPTYHRHIITLHTAGITSIEATATCLRIVVSPSSLTNSNWFIMANAQLEEGLVATPFEQRPIGYELALCQRYYEQGLAYVTIAGYHASYVRVNTMSFNTEKRVVPPNPSVMLSGSLGNTGTVGALYGSGVTCKDLNPTFNWSGGTVGQAFVGTLSWTADAEL